MSGWYDAYFVIELNRPLYQITGVMNVEREQDTPAPLWHFNQRLRAERENMLFKIEADDFNAVQWLIEDLKEILDNYELDKNDMEKRLMKAHSYVYTIEKLLSNY